ncbi:ribonuclease P protein subunit p25-like protein [Ptychodera flava]|uniref:ribonuclease P protein subunit p25-like protein n=1 Tax=Ptychodera flava TaxID=63121 RepID=UPI00396A12D1
MENYELGETVEVEITDLPPNVETAESNEVIQMRVLYGSKIWNLMGFALKKIKEEQVRKVVWNGSGHAVTKAVTCAEIMKRKVKNLHQNTQIYYKRVEDIWKPKLEGLDRLKVNRAIPAISITLSKDQLDKDAPGYQAPNSTEGLWASQTSEVSQSAGKKRKQSSQKGTGRQKKQQEHKKSSQKQRSSGAQGDGYLDNTSKKQKERARDDVPDTGEERASGACRKGDRINDSAQAKNFNKSRQHSGRGQHGGRGRGYHHGYRGRGRGEAGGRGQKSPQVTKSVETGTEREQTGD